MVFRRFNTKAKTSSTHDIQAVSTRSGTTLLASQLHESLFASTADGARIAATFLESDRGQEDGRN